MVKAPRSSGCRVCVQRRIKCDLTKPHCLRCKRANRECPGFESTKFVDEGPTLKALYEVSAQDGSRERKLSDSSAASSSAYEQGDELSTSPSKKAKQKSKPPTPVNAENWESGAFERNVMISIICPTAHQSQLLGDFIESMRQPVQAPTFRCHSMWLREVARRTDPLSCLTWAVRAISISHLGRKTQDANLIETSRRIYGKALWKLNAALQDPSDGLSSDTLSATVILSFYEVFNCTDRYSWIKHAGGAGNLIRLRGPARHRSGVDRAVFVACRYSLIMEAFQTRTPCFLDAPEWRTLGWQIHKDIRNEFPENPVLEANESFFQELVTHPRYLRSAINAVASPQPNLVQLKALFTKGHEHRTACQGIHARMTNEVRMRGHEPIKTASCYNDKVFPVVYEYRDVHQAGLYIGYWAILCALNICLIGLQAKIGRAEQLDLLAQKAQQERRMQGTSSTQPSSAAGNPHIRSDPATASIRGHRPLWDAAVSMGDTHLYIAENAAYAREICKSAEYMAQTPFVGPLFLVLALRMALRMGIARREKEWVLRKLEEIGADMGLARSEIEVYHTQRGETADMGEGMDRPAEWSPQNQRAGRGGWVQTAATGMRRERGPGGKGAVLPSSPAVDSQGRRQRSALVGRGIETPGLGVVIPGAADNDDDEDGEYDVDEDEFEEEGRGLDRAGPPGMLGPGPGWDPTLAPEPEAEVEGFAAGMNPLGGGGGVGASFRGLGPEWEDSLGQWRGGEGVSGT